MIRKGSYKYNYCETDPEQLFNLDDDPLELTNLAESAEHQDLMASFREELFSQWDFAKFKQEVMLSQRCRALVDRANRKGLFTPWDYQPQIDAKQRYMRNHLDLNVVEANNRYPKPSS